MRGLIGLVALGVVVGQLGAFAGTGDPVRESPFPTGGTMEIRGQEVKPGILRLEMGIVPLTGGIHVLGGVKVFAEPSHTLLFAAVDPEKLGAGGLAAVMADHPAARMEGDLGAELSPAVTTRMVSTTDTRIRIEYILVGTDGTRVSHTVRDVAVGNLSRFAFKTGPRFGAPGDAVITSLFPAPPGQASVDCPNERVTICCLDSPCSTACGDARCPKAKGEAQ
jgi:hypothetical protein